MRSREQSDSQRESRVSRGRAGFPGEGRGESQVGEAESSRAGGWGCLHSLVSVLSATELDTSCP